MPENNSINFIEFPVSSIDSLEKQKEFYNNVFNWSFTHWGPDYVDINNCGISGGFNADFTHKGKSILPVIYVNDIEETKKSIIKHGGKITKDIFNIPGGKRLHFIDQDNNEIAIWSDK